MNRQLKLSDSRHTWIPVESGNTTKESIVQATTAILDRMQQKLALRNGLPPCEKAYTCSANQLRQQCLSAKSNPMLQIVTTLFLLLTDQTAGHPSLSKWQLVEHIVSWKLWNIKLIAQTNCLYSNRDNYMIITPITFGSNSPKNPLTNIRLSKALQEDGKTKSRSFTVMQKSHQQFPTVPKLIKEHRQQSVQYFKRYLQDKKKQLENNRRCQLMDKVRKAQEQKHQRQASCLARKANVERKLIQAEFMRQQLRKVQKKQKSEGIHSDLMLKLRNFDRHFQKYSTMKQPHKYTLQHEGYKRLKTDMIEREQKLMETYSNRLRSLEEKGEHLKNRLSFLEKLYSN